MHLRLADDRLLPLDRPYIMGILNVTPDSFSDGGVDPSPAAAVARGLAMARQGADLIDVGGESTRPGAAAVGTEEQIRRVVDVIRGLTAGKAMASIDTQSPEVATAAVAAGAAMVNDVNAGRTPNMLETVAQLAVPIILMHMRGTPRTMQQDPRYGDVVAEVREFLLGRAQAAQAAGIARDRIILDPGIGFGKTCEHNLALLMHLDQLVATGYPILLGASRKRFLGSMLADKDGNAPPPQALVGATCATTASGVANGVQFFRVHDAQANYQAARVAWALRQQGGPA
ncbi:MAG: dihydropteroate synthase [Phycisphaeraceae bacterium]